MELGSTFSFVNDPGDFILMLNSKKTCFFEINRNIFSSAICSTNYFRTMHTINLPFFN